MAPRVKKCCFAIPLKLGVFLVAVFLILNVILEVVIVVTMSSLPPIIIGNGVPLTREGSIFVLDLVFNLVVACCLFYAIPFLDSGCIGIPGVTLFVVNAISFVTFLFNGISSVSLLFAVLALMSVAKVYFAVVLWSFADWIARTYSTESLPDTPPGHATAGAGDKRVVVTESNSSTNADRFSSGKN